MKNILITGGAGHLGKTVVQTLADQDYHLHLAVRKNSDSNNVNVFNYEADLADSEQADAFFQDVLSSNDRIHAGVFLAGGFAAGGLEKAAMRDITDMVNLNFATAFTTAKNLIAHYRANGGGKLIFIGSKLAMEPQTANDNFAYSLSKQMLYNFHDLINKSGKSDGISAHILLPEIIDTALNRSFMPDADFSKWTSTEAIAQTILDIIEDRELRTEITF
ncbi:SDR family NAD(P)-dependent oxidoreductase [Dyadobacter sp. CY326]|uniref:SDR family NAD(P)-dependent oxidoreductase n=1 Tax=Dyadobacter sp. CY326 TaxID=2907300 RepID=UPI001F3D1C52|nr:SDR family NAD(P)-dependent oxidoreductase [Dyadobacter sp. CY326]MCE7063923.1 SDR family NAD(P)-dependent oxidoreductase [Dyadobacter sp. CY326]